MDLRIYLTGRLVLERGATVVEERDFPGLQGRLVAAFLTLERRRLVLRDELAAVLWPRRPPSSWRTSLSAIVSKLRGLLDRIGLDGARALAGGPAGYQLALPVDAWVDVEGAGRALHEAETALRAGEVRRAYGPANAAFMIARRPFLTGEDGAWAIGWRDRLKELYLRAAECCAQIFAWNGEAGIAADYARKVVEREPFRETGYQWLMRAHLAAGNRAEALWVYERCRKLLGEELGVDPSAETKAVYLEVLRSS